MFVFDVSDTEPLPDAPALPKEVTSPFEVRGGTVGSKLERTIENAKRDGVRVSLRSAGSQSAGQIGIATTTASLASITSCKCHQKCHQFSTRVSHL